MARRKSKSAVVMVVAIINLVLGVPCLVCVPTSFAIQGAMKGAVKANARAGQNDPFAQAEEQEAFMEKEAPGYHLMQYLAVGASTLFALGLIVSAILLLMTNPWGRYLCIGVCLAYAIWTAGHAIYQVAVTLPATRKYLDQQFKKINAPPPPKGIFEVSAVFGLTINGLFGIGYPVLAIALLMTPAARKAFAPSKSKELAEDDDFDGPRDDFDDDRPRRRDTYDDGRRDDDYDDRIRPSPG